MIPPLPAHVIPLEQARTLDGLFRERVRRSPGRVAYVDFAASDKVWTHHTWSEMYREVGRWQAALAAENLAPGERIAIQMRNCPEWVLMDQAALGLGLVVVPLYTVDRPDNVAHILDDAGVKLLLLETPQQWAALKTTRNPLASVARMVVMKPADKPFDDPRVRLAADWLPAAGAAPRHASDDGSRLASIVYTSGTTGRPKGVMLSHLNMLSNAQDTLRVIVVREEDEFLSFLPMSHSFERTVGYYLSVMAGARTTYVRSIQTLPDDFTGVRPTCLISVPRIYELVWAKIRAKLEDGPAWQKRLFDLTVSIGWHRFERSMGRGGWSPALLLWPLLGKLVADRVLERLGGRVRIAVSGGAALPLDIARVFIGLGLPLLQGYGMTETSPIIAANRLEDNLPSSVGRAIPGVEVRCGPLDELLVKGANVMLGYWNLPEASAAMFDADGWLKTGDLVRIDPHGHITITGRIKDIIVLSNGEKVSPGDMEAAVLRDALFEQVMLVGEGKPFLSLIAVLDRETWERVAREAGIDPAALASDAAEKLILRRVAAQTRDFPGYAQVRKLVLCSEPWSVENGLLTPTLKTHRARIMDGNAERIAAAYSQLAR